MIRVRIYLYIYVIFIFLVIPSTSPALEKSSKKGCAICHVMWIDDFRTDKKTLIKWQPTNVLMKDTQGVVSSEAICYSCHDGYVNDSRAILWKYNRHPTFVKPSKNVTVPPELPLSNKDEIYCGTCHSAHGVDTEPSARSMFTPFSRVKNIDSSLCEMCHVKATDFKRSNGHPLGTTQLKLPAVLFELGGVRSKVKNKVICQSCHKVHGAKGAKITLVDNINSRLCVICHEKQKSLINTKHDMRLSLPDIINIKQQRVSQSGPCGSCHTPHNAANKRLWARKIESGDLATQMCLSCHSEKSGYDIKHIGKISHPVNDEPTPETSIPAMLPLYTEDLIRSSKGRIQCFTCHDVHRWSPNSTADKGGKDIEGDDSNSFLRISNSASSDLCLNCHKNKRQLITSDHNLIVTAPGEKNIHGLTADQSGPCGGCHVPHNASGVHLWARKIFVNKDMVTQFCVGCHNKDGAAKAKLIGNYYHPVNIPFKMLNTKGPGEKGSALLPFYDSSGKVISDGKDGKIECMTCHDPHTWDPKLTGPVLNYTFKNIEGDTTNSFLRIADFKSSNLCNVCHTDKALVDGTVHDLNTTAPEAVNLLGQTVKESGTCGACHLVHNSPNKLKLWARRYGPVAKNESIMDALCTSCHSKGNIAKNKVPLIATHPAKKLIINIDRVNRDNKNYTLLFDKNGEEVNVGNLSCPSCHNAHQWSFKENGIKDKTENNLSGKFLRAESYNMVCKDCHGFEALIKYEYFHNPEKRVSSKEPLEPDRFKQFKGLSF
jgi:predicted CXXCH cytochrome family protein